MAARLTTAEQATIAAWETHARHRAATENPQPVTVPTRMCWTQHPNLGPGAELLGPLPGRRVVELGCGTGDNLAHLAARHDALAVGVDAAATQIHRARARWGHLPQLRFHHADAANWLADGSEPADVCYAIFGAFDFTPPQPLLALVAARLQPGGRLALSTRHPDRATAGTGQRRADRLRLPDGSHASITRTVATPSQWCLLLHQAGFTVDAVLEPIANGDHTPCCIIIAATH